MNDAAWWARLVQARTQRDDLRPQRVWALRKGEHEAAIDLKAVPGIGAEIVLTVDGELRKARLFRSHEHASAASGSPLTHRSGRSKRGRATHAQNLAALSAARRTHHEERSHTMPEPI